MHRVKPETKDVANPGLKSLQGVSKALIAAVALEFYNVQKLNTVITATNTTPTDLLLFPSFSAPLCLYKKPMSGVPESLTCFHCHSWVLAAAL